MKNFSGTSLLVTAVLTAGFTATAMGQVANDECTGAITLVDGVPVAFDTTSATPSADPAPTDTLCAGSFLDWGTGNRDVWFKYTPSASGTVDLSTCLAGGFDTSMVLYSGACGALTQVACNGDASPADPACQNFFSKITGFGVVAGTTYYVRVGGWNGVEFGAASMLVTFTPAGAGCPAAGSCGEVHPTPGCDDAACCTAVCAANPLCCEIEWDASCVAAAGPACGIFSYQCIAPAFPNDCATNATVFAGDAVFANVSNVGANTDGPTHPGATCSSGNDNFFNDRWWRVQATANGTMRVNTCNATTYDTKLAVYNMGTNPATFNFNTLNQSSVLVGCNDDGPAECNSSGTAVFPSDLSVSVSQGNWYLVRLATFDVPGVATLNIDMPEPCQLPTSTSNEAEACGDATNNGCNAAGEVATINLGDRVRGTFATFVDPVTGAESRDTDFYRLDLANDTTVTVNINSASFVTGLILTGDVSVAECDGVNIFGSTGGSCPSTGEFCLSAGTYYIFVAPATFAGIPCGSGALNEYVVEVTGVPASCPIILDQVCADPSVDTYLSSTAAVGGGLVSCAVAGSAFPACSTGGTTANTFARPMPAGAIGGAITCVNFGAFSVVRAANAGNTACATFASDLPLPSTIGIYEDIDGGAPRNKILAEGDGNDLRLIEQREVLIPGGAYLANLDFDPPLCLDGVTGNIVVIMDCPDLFNIGATPSIPDQAGYGLRPSGGTVTGQGSGTYVRLSCADAAAQYVLAESLGATFTAQWVVSFNGDFSTCETAPECPGDLNNDGVVNGADLSGVLSGWGTAAGDVNGDGTTNGADLSTVLGNWGTCPQ